MIYQQTIQISTKGFCDVIDITNKVKDIIDQSQIKNGLVTVFVKHSTAGITIIETQAGVEDDLKEALFSIVSVNKDYHHNQISGDSNGFSHVLSGLVGPSLSVPIIDSQMALGTWQMIVLCDFDNRSRDREIVVQILN